MTAMCAYGTGSFLLSPSNQPTTSGSLAPRVPIFLRAIPDVSLSSVNMVSHRYMLVLCANFLLHSHLSTMAPSTEPRLSSGFCFLLIYLSGLYH